MTTWHLEPMYLTWSLNYLELYLIYRIKDMMPSFILKTSYDAHALPRLVSFSPTWCSTCPTHLLPLSRLQKKTIRIVTSSDYFEHIEPLFQDNNMLKLLEINKLQIVTYKFKSNTILTTLQTQHYWLDKTIHPVLETILLYHYYINYWNNS